MNQLRKQIHQLPKADFHHHLHLGGDIQSLKYKYNQTDFTIPGTYHGLKGMIQFIEGSLNTLIQESDDVIHLMDTALQSSIEDNVKYLEASVDLKLARFFGGSLEALIEVVQSLKSKYQPQLDFRPDIGLNKDLPKEEAGRIALKCIESQVFSGIDIYGPEDGKDLHEYTKIYEVAKEAKLKTKVHIGEFSQADTIDKALEILDPEVLQHGIRAIDNEKTMDSIAQKGVRLNICPQSNLALGAVSSLEEHPIRTFYERGVSFSINTDDFLLFGASITDQYLDLIQAGIFSFEEIVKINQDAIDSCGQG